MTDSPKLVPDFSAHRIGFTACRLLSSPGREGKVLAVVANCIYLVDPDSQLFWLANENVPLHARSIQLAGGLPRLQPGQPFRISEGELVFQTGVRVEAANAEVWRPPGVFSERLMGFPEIYEKSLGIYSLLAEIPHSGFGAFIAPILACARNEGLSHQPGFSDPILSYAWPAIQAVARATACRDLRSLLPQVNNLVGLGSGLTPSGDDFLGGLFFGLHTLNKLTPSKIDLDGTQVSRVLAQAKLRTNLISAALLNDLAGGLGPEPIHAFIRFLLPQVRASAALDHARALASIGHSTGWDILTGLMCGLLWTCPPQGREARGRMARREWVETAAL